MKINFRVLLLTYLLFNIFSTDLFADKPPPYPHPNNPYGDKNGDGKRDNGKIPARNTIPIDGGISLLLTASLAFGAGKLFIHKKETLE